MTFFAVLSVIIILVCLLLFSNLKVNIRSGDELYIRAGLGIFTFPLHPKKEKQIKLKDFTQRKYLKKLSKLSLGANPKNQAEEKASEEGEKSGFSETADFIIHLLSRVESYTKRLKTTLREFSVTVGGKEADKTAITYSLVSQTATYLLEILDEKTKLKINDPDKVSVKCDFLAEKITFSLDLTISISVLDALKTLCDILVMKLRHDTEIKNKSQKERTN